MAGYQIVNQNGLHFLTFTIVGWVDVFTRKTYRDIIIESFIYCKEYKGLQLHAYVTMSHHIHIIASTVEGRNLSELVRDFKRYTSRKIIRTIIEEPGESRPISEVCNFREIRLEHK